MRGEAVTQLVRRQSRVQPRRKEVSLEPMLQGPRGQRPRIIVRAPEDRLVGGRRSGQRRPVVLNRSQRMLADRNDAFLSPLPSNANGRLGEIEILRLQPAKLADA